MSKRFDQYRIAEQKILDAMKKQCDRWQSAAEIASMMGWSYHATMHRLASLAAQGVVDVDQRREDRKYRRGETVRVYRVKVVDAMTMPTWMATVIPTVKGAVVRFVRGRCGLGRK